MLGSTRCARSCGTPGRTILYGIGGSFLGGFVSRAIGVNSTLVQLAIAVAAAAGLIWFFTRRKPKASP